MEISNIEYIKIKNIGDYEIIPCILLLIKEIETLKKKNIRKNKCLPVVSDDKK